jgi:hypothetical protein
MKALCYILQQIRKFSLEWRTIIRNESDDIYTSTEKVVGQGYAFRNYSASPSFVRGIGR